MQMERLDAMCRDKSRRFVRLIRYSRLEDALTYRTRRMTPHPERRISR